MSHLQTIKDLIGHISDDEIHKLEVGGIVFDDSRKSIIRSADSVDFQAVPGSGKTTVLVSKLLLIAEKWSFENRGICVLSHTNVAKNEIHKKITESGLGKNLLKYPHFIGTIQEFVDKYLAYPVIRYCGYNVHTIDTDLCKYVISKNLTSKTRFYMQQNPNTDCLYITINSILPLKFNIPGFKSSSQSDTYNNLHNAKKTSLEEGFFFYEDMYAFANYALGMYPEYINNVRNRFPLIFIDEAQDNNKTQDELLEKIFNTVHCIYQRFGDSDQAIYDFQSADGTNTFGTEADRLSDINISDSKRFPTEHLSLINKFKCSDIGLTALSAYPKLSPQIFYYTDTSKSQVVRNFLDLIDTHFNYEEQPIVKVIGFIHKEGTPHNIGSYIINFKKYRKDKKVETLIELVHTLKCNLSGTNTAFYSIIGFILKCHKIDYQDRQLTLQRKSAIRLYLNEMDIDNTFRKSLLSLLKNEIDTTTWQAFCSVIVSVFGISSTLSDKITTFVATSEEPISVEDDIDVNSIKCDNDNCLYTPIKHIKVEIDTIHGVKGETHDATLVLETQNRYKDITFALKTNTINPTKIKFRKQLYVGTTRAKSLLCIAVEDTQDNRQFLSDILTI